MNFPTVNSTEQELNDFLKEKGVSVSIKSGAWEKMDGATRQTLLGDIRYVIQESELD